MTERVLVTGITGYIGQHCGAELLRQGYEVVGTVRSKSKAESTRSALGEVGPADKLTLVEADLLSDDGWDEAVTAAPTSCMSRRRLYSPNPQTKTN